jgi:hypothetical protein
MEKFGSGINIPDPQHCVLQTLRLSFVQSFVAVDERLIGVERCVLQTLRSSFVHSFVAEDERLIGAERCVPQTLRLSLL